VPLEFPSRSIVIPAALSMLLTGIDVFSVLELEFITALSRVRSFFPYRLIAT